MDKSPEAFRTISEVAETLGTPAHVLRFWESRFPQVRPVKRAGGRRYYRPSDVALLAGIRRLLHDDGLTIRGVQKLLREHGVRHVAAFGGLAPLPAPEADTADIDAVLADLSARGPDVDEEVVMPEETAGRTAQVISLAALVRSVPEQPELPLAVEGAAPDGLPTETVAEEAPFIEVEEEPLPEPIAFMPQAGKTVADGEIPGQSAEAAEEDVASSPEPGAETTAAMRLRRLDRADVADRRIALAALRERMLELRGRLARGVRRRAR